MFFVLAITFCLGTYIFQSPIVSTSLINLSHSDFFLNEYFMISNSYDANGFLDRRYFSNKDREIIHRSDNEPNQLDNQAWSYNLDTKSIKRKLIRYKVWNVVHCLDSLFVERNRSVYIIFIGDSIMRNQFKNFITVSMM